MMNADPSPSPSAVREPDAIDPEFLKKIRDLPRLASLRSINAALSELLRSEDSYTHQIAEIIRRDPSLTTRLLRLVNSVFYGFSKKITSIEEAVFFLGIRQIRELAMVTPVIEEIERLSDRFKQGRWQQLWLHSIGTAILTREIAQSLSLAGNEENEYIAGLVHNIGKIVMALLFPDVLEEATFRHANAPREIVAFERERIGYDHAEIGAVYLRYHQLSPDIVEAVRFHHFPEEAGDHRKLAAAIQVADVLMRSTGVPGIDPLPAVSAPGIKELEGWEILFGDAEDQDLRFASLAHAASRLPTVLRGVV